MKQIIDPRRRTRLLYKKEDDDQLYGTGATPRSLKEIELDQSVRVLNSKPFILGEDFTDEEIACAQAA